MEIEELLRAGIAAAKAKDIAEASKLLVQVVQTDPNSELGWLWLGLCCTAPEQREYCFRKVLTINPQNSEAKREIEFLRQPTVNSQVEKPLNPPSSPSRGSAPPFIEPPQDILPGSQKASLPHQGKKSVPQEPQKKDHATLIWISVGIVTLICIAITGIVLIGRITALRNAPVYGIPSPTSVPIMTAVAMVKPTPNYTPVFEAAPCNFRSPGQAQITCGFVSLPEDRSGDLTDTIRIAVAVFHSTSNAPKPEPVLYLQGGPGGEAIKWSIGAYQFVIAPLLGERDFIVFDPRGVGYSEPALDCGEFSATYLQDLQGKIPADQKVSYYQGALLGCKNNLLKVGANLSTYTSTNSAADARDILVALGYQRANLYGISYGTRVAQFIIRDYPEMIRSAILDSVVPVEVQLLNQSTVERDYALTVLFDDCKSDPACSSAYPDLESAYNEVVNQLNAHPVKLTIPIDQNRKLEQVVDGYTFRDTIAWTLRMPQAIGSAPQLIYRSRDGDNSILISSLAFPILSFDSISMGTYISVNCHDQVFAMSTEKLDSTIFDMCELWEATPPLPGENDPVNSEIPTLIFAGKYDPVTPPSFAHQFAEHFTHSYIAEIPNQGHAPSATGLSDCPTKLISAFLQDPNSSPDFTCVNETKAIKFIVPYDGNTPLILEPAIIDQYQINTHIPAGWSDVGLGFYNRNGSFGDITQMGLQRATVSESEWATWLSTNFKGSQGFDRPAIKHDERQANRLTWSIYETSSQGYPVDIAFANSDNQTLMILLISYKDEHDALYNTVFLPIIDATQSSK